MVFSLWKILFVHMEIQNKMGIKAIKKKEL